MTSKHTPGGFGLCDWFEGNGWRYLVMHGRVWRGRLRKGIETMRPVGGKVAALYLEAAAIAKAGGR